MIVIRPITLGDLDGLIALARLAGPGMTTLPPDEKVLARRIRESLRGFEKLADEDPPRGETYLFVMEDLATRQMVGVSGIISKVGGFEPFYAYRIETSLHESKALKVHKQIKTLNLVEEHDGPCEIGSLFLRADYRRHGNGRLLSLARFLFMADHIDYFDPTIIAEMRGVVDANGRSPLWEAIGRHFFGVDYLTADHLSMVSKKFIAELMPEHPIYIPLLPQDAQEVIGQVHSETAAALRILEDEGFSRCGLVDIFEGGPVVRCALAKIRTIRRSVRSFVSAICDEPIEGTRRLISNCRHEMRAVADAIRSGANGGVEINRAVAAALDVKAGDAVRYVSLFAEPEESEAPDGGEVSLY